MLIPRNDYLNFLLTWKDKQIIKVVSGIRRCGKSTLFELYQDRLLEEGVLPNQIISVNFEDMDNERLCDYRALHDYVTSKMTPGKMNYIFLDEIQHVQNFQKAVDSLFIRKNADVYVTGSNAYFMSGELATTLTGRYVELKMLPLSFKEYVCAFDKTRNLEELYRNYVYNSSFPYVAGLTNRREIHAYLDGLFNTILLNDVVQRKRIQDPLMLKSVVNFMFDNVGNLCSPKKIADAMTSKGRKISNHTVENYLEGLTDSLLMYRVGRYDVKGKDYLKLQDKYYLADVGLRYYLLGVANVDQGRILENVVYLELLRRGYRIYVGKNGPVEIDFVAKNADGETEYYQVSWSVKDESTFKRELTAFESIKDHNPKYLLTMDNDPPVSYNGIRQRYALDWLLGNVR